jgi:chromosome transmission fidelity protein 1
MSDYMNHLFSYVPPERLDTFSYGHVIPHTNLVAQSLTKGLMGSDFDFTYEARNSEKMVSNNPVLQRPAFVHANNKSTRSPTLEEQ